MKIVLIVWSALGLSAGVFAASYDSFRPGAEWLDTDGNSIQAHGGSIITVGDMTIADGVVVEATTPIPAQGDADNE